eukprot:TRINITY_DN40668_c0_g1_i1.p1 TRINITY_DN40668_c0_g1~~TRINITY_DN40668_c0_g1_i1.p1  ORF type:complete len:264 (+),score=84.25 TRINITY_DN40668_c0_g1_i1:47-793(+)
MEGAEPKMDLNDTSHAAVEGCVGGSRTEGAVTVCELCGRGVGMSLMRIHQKQCARRSVKKAEADAEKKRDDEGKRSKVCRTCGTTFSVELHAIHKKTCRKKVEQRQQPMVDTLPLPLSPSLSEKGHARRRVKMRKPKVGAVNGGSRPHNVEPPSDCHKLKSKYDAIITTQRKLENRLEGIFHQLQPKEPSPKARKDPLPPITCPMAPVESSSIPYLKNMLCRTYTKPPAADGSVCPSLIPVHKNRRVL